MKIPGIRPTRAGCVLLVILILAAALRLHGIGFGLPALNDPDEPLFVTKALDMLRHQTLNPGWFGHPGTTTFYALALIDAGVAALGLMTGRFDGASGFVQALYADPGIVVLPGRIFIASCGVACVYLSHRIVRQFADARTSLIAALFLAVNAVHVHYSQIIRTDMQAAVFMLLCILCARRIARAGRLRDHLLAGLCVGLACATKWPAAAIAIAPVCAAWAYAAMHGGAARQQARYLALFAGTAILSLLATSPYLLIDYQTVLQNLQGEARPEHLGATGHGLFGNLLWYGGGPLRASIGWSGLILAALGMGTMAWRHRIAATVLLPAFILFLLIISGQTLVWERWLVPLLPFIATFMALGLVQLAAWLRRPKLVPVIALVLASVMAVPTVVETRERLHDTRQMASAWIKAHAPAGSSILIEDAAFDLLPTTFGLKFPMGSAGCVDVRLLLAGKASYSSVETLRRGRAIVDLGNVDPARLATCTADFAILTHVDRYAGDQGDFARERRIYQTLLKSGRIMVRFEATPGRSTGPVTYVVKWTRR